MNKRAYSYYRDQNEESIEMQRKVTRNFAKENGIDIIGEYIDRTKTGSGIERDSYQEMLSDLDKNSDVTCILVHKTDRLHRNVKISLDTISGLDEKGIKIIATGIK